VRWEAKTKTILFAGRVHPEKGIELLLRAWQRLRSSDQLVDWTLVLVGPHDVCAGGGGQVWLDQLRSNFPADGVKWLPPIFDEVELARTYQRASVFVYPSIAERGETFGLAPLEAMAWGAVPVVSNLACFRDFITPGRNGVSFDHRAADPVSALAAALVSAAAESSAPLASAATAVRKSHACAAIAAEFLSDFASLR
jgi:glycosyltransferase involved in cell wall biosynthesis